MSSKMNKLNKVKAEVSKRLDQDNVNMTAYRDYDFDRRTTDMRRLAHALSHFDHAITTGMVAMKDIASSFEAIGQAFTELTLGTVNTYDAGTAGSEPNPYPTADEDLSAYNNTSAVHYDANNTSGGGGGTDGSSPMRARSDDNVNNASGANYAASAASTRLTDETNGQVRRLARLFAEETRRMNSGQPFQSYNAGMHRDVVTRLRPVSEHLNAVEEYRQKRTEALDKYNKLKAEVEKIEKQCTKKGKPFCDSKSHKKVAEKRDLAWSEYSRHREKFNESFALLMEVNDHAAAQIIHRYLALNDEYLRQLVQSIRRILPAMAEAYPLNQEYTSAQNQMILEAVASARTPFAKHYADQPPTAAAAAAGEEDEHEHAMSDGDDGNASMDGYNDGDNDVPPTRKTNAKQAPSSSSSHTPASSDRSASGGGGGDDDENDARGDYTGGAGNTGEEPGYALTQPMRLHTGEMDSSAADHHHRLPGTAD